MTLKVEKSFLSVNVISLIVCVVHCCWVFLLLCVCVCVCFVFFWGGGVVLGWVFFFFYPFAYQMYICDELCSYGWPYVCCLLNIPATCNRPETAGQPAILCGKNFNVGYYMQTFHLFFFFFFNTYRAYRHHGLLPLYHLH